MLDKSTGKNYSCPQKHQLQMALSSGNGQHIFEVLGEQEDYWSNWLTTAKKEVSSIPKHSTSC